MDLLIIAKRIGVYNTLSPHIDLGLIFSYLAGFIAVLS